MANKIYNYMRNDEDYNYSLIKVLDLSQQILNSRINIFEEHENLDELFKIYNKVLNNYINEATEESLDSSKKSLLDNDLQKLFVIKLKPNESDSFLIVPIIASGHMFAGVIRKYDDLYSLIVVNKANKFKDSKHVEYLFTKDGIILMLDTVLNAKFSVPKIYSKLKLNSLDHYNLSIESREQKLGNCFIKEPENAIKFAVATSNGDINSLKKYRDSKVINKIKWPISTTESHKGFIEELVREYPQFKDELINELDIYVTNKAYRKYLTQGYENKTAFLKFFSPIHKKQANSFNDITPEFIKECMKKLNYDTLCQNPKQIMELIENTNDTEYINKFKELYKLNLLSELYVSMPKTLENIYKIVNLFSFSKTSLKKRFINGIRLNEESFPNITSKIKYDVHSGLVSITTLNSLFFRPQKLLKRLNESIELVPYDYNLYVIRSLIHMMLRNKPKALEDLKYALKINPNFKKAKELIVELELESKTDKSEIGRSNIAINTKTEKQLSDKNKLGKTIPINVKLVSNNFEKDKSGMYI